MFQRPPKVSRMCRQRRPLRHCCLNCSNCSETVEGQSEKIAKQTQELESERAAVLDELDRIAKLETELHAPSNEAEDLLASARPPRQSVVRVRQSDAGLGSAAAVPVVQAANSSGARQRGQAVRRTGAKAEKARPPVVQRRLPSTRGCFLWWPERPVPGPEPAKLPAAFQY